jgi:hypothetical protein
VGGHKIGAMGVWCGVVGTGGGGYKNGDLSSLEKRLYVGSGKEDSCGER